jgi:tRNA pseudouridine55 synthase
MTGDILQRPPAFSALKVDGRRAYARARAGETVEPAPRTIHVYMLDVVGYEYPRLELDIECSAGTYVRSLGRDIAERAGTGAAMSALTRTAVGPFTLDDAVALDALSRETISRRLVPALRAVDKLMPVHVVSEELATRLAHGLVIECPDETSERLAAVDGSGKLIAILARRAEGAYRPSKYFPLDR